MKMRVVFCIVVASAFASNALLRHRSNTFLASVPVPTFGADKPETPHLAFVTEYIRGLSAIEALRAGAEQELKQGEGGPSAVFSNAVYTSTRMQFELRTQINVLKGMRLNPPFEEIISNLTKFYEGKIELWQQLAQVRHETGQN